MRPIPRTRDSDPGHAGTIIIVPSLAYSVTLTHVTEELERLVVVRPVGRWSVLELICCCWLGLEA